MKKASQVLLILIISLTLILLPACSSSKKGEPENEAESKTETESENETETTSALEKFPESDMSGYDGLEGYDGEIPFVDVTVQAVHELMESKETFVLIASFSTCPWCNAIIRDFVEVVNEEGVKVAYINTRRDPSWKNNMDIEDYDLFVEDFGEYLDIDGDGREHLYVPHVFFVKNGEVVHEHQGALPAMGSDPNMKLSDEQHEELKNIYREGFSK